MLSGAGKKLGDLSGRLLASMESEESFMTSSSELPEGLLGPEALPCR